LSGVRQSQRKIIPPPPTRERKRSQFHSPPAVRGLLARSGSATPARVTGATGCEPRAERHRYSRDGRPTPRFHPEGVPPSGGTNGRSANGGRQWPESHRALRVLLAAPPREIAWPSRARRRPPPIASTNLAMQPAESPEFARMDSVSPALRNSLPPARADAVRAGRCECVCASQGE